MKFGQYELLERIAVGGMAEVYRGRVAGAEGFEKLVAIKRVLPEFARDERFISMLLTEARIHSALSHRNIVQIHDLGISEDGEYFIVLEYVEGHDLRAVMEAANALGVQIPDSLALHVANEVAQALHFAHELKDADGHPLGIVHRDVSPSNVLLSNSGEVKLSDFGIAKRQRDHSVVGSLKGSLMYMAPEQAKKDPKEPVDRRTDVFSLGAVLFEMLTGQKPREIKNEFDGWSTVVGGGVRSARELRPDLPDAYEALLARATAANPSDRFPDASAFGGAILELLRESEFPPGPNDIKELLEVLDPPRHARSPVERSKVIRLGPESKLPAMPSPAGSDDAAAATPGPERLASPAIPAPTPLVGMASFKPTAPAVVAPPVAPAAVTAPAAIGQSAPVAAPAVSSGPSPASAALAAAANAGTFTPGVTPRPPADAGATPPPVAAPPAPAPVVTSPSVAAIKRSRTDLGLGALLRPELLAAAAAARSPVGEVGASASSSAGARTPPPIPTAGARTPPPIPVGSARTPPPVPLAAKTPPPSTLMAPPAIVMAPAPAILPAAINGASTNGANGHAHGHGGGLVTPPSLDPGLPTPPPVAVAPADPAATPPPVGIAPAYAPAFAAPAPQRTTGSVGQRMSGSHLTFSGPTAASFLPPDPVVLPKRSGFGFGKVLLVLVLLIGAGAAYVHLQVMPLGLLLVWNRPASLQVTSEPDGADVKLDGRPIGGATPARVQVKRDRANHTLEVSKTGFASEQRIIRFDREGDFLESMRLTALPPPPPPPEVKPDPAIEAAKAETAKAEAAKAEAAKAEAVADDAGKKGKHGDKGEKGKKGSKKAKKAKKGKHAK